MPRSQCVGAAQKSPSAISEGNLGAGPTKEGSGCAQRKRPLLVVRMRKLDAELLSDVRDAWNLIFKTYLL